MKASMRLILTILVATVLAACTTNPVRDADTFEQKAYALYGTYVIFQGKAAQLKQAPSTPVKVKAALSEADRVAYPIAEGLVEAAIQVSDIRELLEQCSTLPDPAPHCVPTNERRLANALANLSTIYFRAQPVLWNLVAAVKQTQEESP